MAMWANSDGGTAVSDLFSAYCELISSPAQLARCRAAVSVSDLLSVIKELWQQTTLTDGQLLAELAQLNQQFIDDDNIQLAGHWLPYRYHAKSRCIYWCLTDGHAAEPFQDQALSRYRQTVLVNQFITPNTALSSLSAQAQRVKSITPAGFIFHLSRCGSTLLSGCLSELETTCVLSESPVLTEILLDHNLDKAQQQHYVQQLINLQASLFPQRQDVVIKWNAWDIFYWNLLRRVYPEVPSVFLVRNPLEVLASHQGSAGRHMSGDPSLSHCHPVFSFWDNAGDLLEKRIAVLGALLNHMHAYSSNQNVFLLDYRQCNIQTIAKVSRIFCILWDELRVLTLQNRMRFHSKSLDQIFLSDGEDKLSVFSPSEQKMIQMSLAPIYRRLLTITNDSTRAVINDK